MTDSKHSPSAGPPRSGNVLDPKWEETLRRGQEAEGEAGSVEAELAFVHLLRHSREPEALAPEDLDAIWSQIGAELETEAVGAAPWWRKAWIWWSAPALAAAAVLVVIVIDPGGNEAATIAQQDESVQSVEKTASAPASDESIARGAGGEGSAGPGSSKAQSAEQEPPPLAGAAEDSDGSGSSGNDQAVSRSASASPFEVSFAKLAPHGRVAIRVGVDQSRDELRSQLLAKARGGGR